MKSLPLGSAHAPYPSVIHVLMSRQHQRSLRCRPPTVQAFPCPHMYSAPSLPLSTHWGGNFCTVKGNSKMRAKSCFPSLSCTGRMVRGGAACCPLLFPRWGLTPGPFPGISRLIPVLVLVLRCEKIPRPKATFAFVFWKGIGKDWFGLNFKATVHHWWTSGQTLVEKGQKVKVIHGYTVISRPAWATRGPAFKINKQQQNKTKSKHGDIYL